jgi:Rel/ankyrin family protein
VKILEQPASHKLRFRYECEGRSAGALQGCNSTSENKTYPTIKVEGYKGPAVVVVSCVEERPPFRAHPHNLVGRGSICRKGVCSMEITNEDMTCQVSTSPTPVWATKFSDIFSVLDLLPWSMYLHCNSG